MTDQWGPVDKYDILIYQRTRPYEEPPPGIQLLSQLSSAFLPSGRAPFSALSRLTLSRRWLLRFWLEDGATSRIEGFPRSLLRWLRRRVTRHQCHFLSCFPRETAAVGIEARSCAVVITSTTLRVGMLV